MAEAAGIYLVDEVLLVAMRDDITDTGILELQDALAERVSTTGAHGVILDISALEIVDTFVGRVIAQLARTGRLLDATTYVVGMRPAVAMTLVELGMTLPATQTALNLGHAMEKLRAQRR